MSTRADIRKRMRLLASVIGEGSALNLSRCSLVDYDDVWQVDPKQWEEIAHDDFITVYRRLDGQELRAKYLCRVSDEELLKRNADLSYL